MRARTYTFSFWTGAYIPGRPDSREASPRARRDAEIYRVACAATRGTPRHESRRHMRVIHSILVPGLLRVGVPGSFMDLIVCLVCAPFLAWRSELRARRYVLIRV